MTAETASYFKAMRGRIALPMHFVRNARFVLRKLWQCALPARRMQAFPRPFCTSSARYANPSALKVCSTCLK